MYREIIECPKYWEARLEAANRFTMTRLDGDCPNHLISSQPCEQRGAGPRVPAWGGTQPHSPHTDACNTVRPHRTRQSAKECGMALSSKEWIVFLIHKVLLVMMIGLPGKFSVLSVRCVMKWIFEANSVFRLWLDRNKLLIVLVDSHSFLTCFFNFFCHIRYNQALNIKF